MRVLSLNSLRPLMNRIEMYGINSDYTPRDKSDVVQVHGLGAAGVCPKDQWGFELHITCLDLWASAMGSAPPSKPNLILCENIHIANESRNGLEQKPIRRG